MQQYHMNQPYLLWAVVTGLVSPSIYDTVTGHVSPLRELGSRYSLVRRASLACSDDEMELIGTF